MEYPKVSIVLPTYNRVEWLVKSVESVISQTYQNWELFVIDDISSDGTKERMEEYCNFDHRIKYFRIPVTDEVGISKFLNFGINNGNGKYIARLDDDDKWIDNDKIKKQVEFLEKNSDYVLIGGGVIVIDNKENELYRYLENETDEQIRRNALLSNPFTHPTVVFRRDAAEKIGGYKVLEFAEDWDFFLRLGNVGKMYNLPEYVAHYTMAGQNISIKNQRELAKNLFGIIKTHRNHYPNYWKGYLVNTFQLLHSYLPSKLRRNSTTFLRYIKRKYF